MAVIGDDDCVVFTPRLKAPLRWPVRIANQQGLWRYVGPLKNTSKKYVEVIGPYFPGNPSRNGGRSRIVHVDDLKYAGKHAKPVDVISVETTAISNQAKQTRR